MRPPLPPRLIGWALASEASITVALLYAASAYDAEARTELFRRCGGAGLATVAELVRYNVLCAGAAGAGA
eukprot:gene49825-46960_t